MVNNVNQFENNSSLYYKIKKKKYLNAKINLES